MEGGSSERCRRCCCSIILIGISRKERILAAGAFSGFVMMGAAREEYQRANVAAPIINRKLGSWGELSMRGVTVVEHLAAA